MNNDPASNPHYPQNGFVSQLNSPSDAFGLYFNRDDRTEYIELNRDGTFLQYERNAQLIGRYAIEQGVLRMAFSDGRVVKMFMGGNSFNDQQGRTWMKKERVPYSTPPPPSYQVPPYQVSQPTSKAVTTWTSVIVAAAAFVIVATQWSKIEGWIKRSSPRHYSESSASWEARTLPGTGMTVDLPSEPDKDPSPISSADSPYIKDMQVYGKEYDNLEYVMMYVLASVGIEPKAEDGARGGMEEFKKEPQVTGLDYRITASDPRHASISGTCIYQGHVASVEGVVQTKTSKMWAIFIISRTDDAEARAAAKRIISSARFE